MSHSEDPASQVPSSSDQDSNSEQKNPAWKHNQNVSLNKMVPYLEEIKGRVQNLIQIQKKELQRLVGVRDSIQKSK